MRSAIIMTRDEPSIDLPPAQFFTELTRAHQALSAFGPVRWFRPGGGRSTPAMRSAARQLGYRTALGEVYPLTARPLGDVDSPSCCRGGPARLNRTCCMDRGARGWRTAEALGHLLPALAARGYRVVTLSALGRGGGRRWRISWAFRAMTLDLKPHRPAARPRSLLNMKTELRKIAGAAPPNSPVAAAPDSQHHRPARPSRKDRLSDVRRQNARRRILLSAGTSASRARRLPFVLLPDGKDQFLVPPVGILRETGTLHPYDAEALAGGRLHHHPALQAVHHLGA